MKKSMKTKAEKIKTGHGNLLFKMMSAKQSCVQKYEHSLLDDDLRIDYRFDDNSILSFNLAGNHVEMSTTC